MQSALILGQHLLDLVRYVPQEQWRDWVQTQTPLTIPDAEAFVTFTACYAHLAAPVTPGSAMSTTKILEALVGLTDAFKEAVGVGAG